MEWIKCSERLPTDQDLYLCCGKTIDWNMGKIPDIAFTAYFYLPNQIYSTHRWMERTRSCEDVTVEYWMPLPSPPKE